MTILIKTIKSIILPSHYCTFILSHDQLKKRLGVGGGHAARMGKRTGLHRALVGNLEGKRQPGKCRRRWQDNIRMNL